MRLRPFSTVASFLAALLFAGFASASDDGPKIRTDLIDYPPGATAHISGEGFHAFEAVVLQVVHTNEIAEPGNGHEPWLVFTDGNGHLETTWYVDPDDSLGATFLLTADCQHTGPVPEHLSASWTFTDGPINGFNIFGTSGAGQHKSTANAEDLGTISPGTTQTFTIYAAKQPGQSAVTAPMTVTIDSGTPAGLLASVPTQVTSSTAGTPFLLTVTAPINVQGKTYVGKIVATSGADTEEYFFKVTATGGNQAPTANAQSVSATEDTAKAITLSGSDPESSPLTYTVVSGPSHGSLSGTAPNLTYTPSENYNGPDSFTFKVSDGSLSSGEATVSINVAPQNDAPSANGDTYATDEDEPLQISAPGVLANDSDIENDPLTAVVSQQPQHGTLTLNADGSFTYTPNADYNGPDSFSYTAHDATLGSAPVTVSLTVHAVNDAPTLDAVSDKTGDEGTQIQFTAGGHDVDEGSILVYSLVGAPAGASIDATTGVFTWTPTEAQGPGEFTFTVKVSDGFLTAEQTVKITVGEVNQAPELAAIGAKSVDEGQALTFAVSGTDADLPANALTYSAMGLPEGATFDPDTRTFSWTPTEAQGPGTYSVTFKVSDNGTPGMSDEETVEITVGEVNKAPTLGTITDRSTPWGVSLSFYVSASDEDLPANTLSYSLIEGPSGASIDSNTGEFTWTPGADKIGDNSFRVKVTDNGDPSLSDEKTFKITVNKRKSAVSYTGASSAQYSDRAEFAAVVTDADEGPLAGTQLSGRSVTFVLTSHQAVASTDSNGVAGATVVLDDQGGVDFAQATTVATSVSATASYCGASDSDSFQIRREDALTAFTGDLSVATAGPTINSTTVRLAAQLTPVTAGETAPDTAGDIRKAKVRFEIFKSSNLSNVPDYTVANVFVNADGTALTTTTLPVDTYVVKTSVDPTNTYWRSCPFDQTVLNVDLGSNDRRTNGGGWIAESRSVNGKANFGFTVNYMKNGSPKGQAVFVIRGTDGFNYVVKSNSWQGGGLSFGTGSNYYKAAFTVRCVIQKVDRETGTLVASQGNCTMIVDVEDGDLLTPKIKDKYGIRVLWSDGSIWYTNGGVQTLGGGNVIVFNK